MERGSKKTNSKTIRNEEKRKKPYVVSLSSVLDVRSLAGVDLDNSWVVFLDKNNPTHIRQLEKFMEWLNENNRSNFEETEELS